jgi:hypothetical protein
MNIRASTVLVKVNGHRSRAPSVQAVHAVLSGTRHLYISKVRSQIQTCFNSSRMTTPDWLVNASKCPWLCCCDTPLIR